MLSVLLVYRYFFLLFYNVWRQRRNSIVIPRLHYTKQNSHVLCEHSAVFIFLLKHTLDNSKTVMYSNFLQLTLKHIRRLKLISNYATCEYNASDKEFKVCVNYTKIRLITFAIRIYLSLLFLSLFVSMQKSTLLGTAAGVGFVALRVCYYGMFRTICDEGILEAALFLVSKKLKFETFIIRDLGKQKRYEWLWDDAKVL